MVFEYALRILGPAQAETAGTYQHPAFQASLRCSCVLAESFSFQVPDYAVSGGGQFPEALRLLFPERQCQGMGWLKTVLFKGAHMKTRPENLKPLHIRHIGRHQIQLVPEQHVFLPFQKGIRF